MALYETTFFSRQKTQGNLAAFRPKINERLTELRGVGTGGYGGYEAIRTQVARNNIKGACGNPHTANGHVYEISIGGQWRIFFGQGYSGGVVVFCVGHLVGNNIQLP